MNKNKRDKELARIESFDRAMKDKLVTALMLVPPLSVMILSVVYQSVNAAKYATETAPGLVLGYLTLLTVAAVIALAVMYNKTFVTLAISLIFGLASISYGMVMFKGTTNVLDDGFFDMLMSVFVLPVISYISVTGVGSGNSQILPLIISVIITGGSIAATVVIIKKQKKAEEEREREAEARKSRNSRRKVR